VLYCRFQPRARTSPIWVRLGLICKSFLWGAGASSRKGLRKKRRMHSDRSAAMRRVPVHVIVSILACVHASQRVEEQEKTGIFGACTGSSSCDKEQHKWQHFCLHRDKMWCRRTQPAGPRYSVRRDRAGRGKSRHQRSGTRPRSLPQTSHHARPTSPSTTCVSACIDRRIPPIHCKHLELDGKKNAVLALGPAELCGHHIIRSFGGLRLRSSGAAAQ